MCGWMPARRAHPLDGFAAVLAEATSQLGEVVAERNVSTRMRHSRLEFSVELLA